MDTIDVTEIPPPIPVPSEKNVSDGKYSFVSVDVETTSFGKCDIVQISGATGTSHFDSYVVPSQQIVPSASKGLALLEISCYSMLNPSFRFCLAPKV